MTHAEYLEWGQRMSAARSVEELRQVLIDAAAAHPDDPQLEDLRESSHHQRMRLRARERVDAQRSRDR